MFISAKKHHGNDQSVSQIILQNGNGLRGFRPNDQLCNNFIHLGIRNLAQLLQVHRVIFLNAFV